MSSPTTDGYAAFLVSPNVTRSPDTPGVQFRDVLTVFLNAKQGSGGIDTVINGVGGSSTAANPSKPVDVASYP